MKESLRLATYQPDIPQNLGAMIRLCACLGVPIDIIEPCGFPFSKKALRRTAMDYLDIAEIKQHDSFESFYSYKKKKRIILLTTSGDIDLWDFTFMKSDILMVGRESSGVPPAVSNTVDYKVKVAMPAGGRSLNVVTCAAIAVAEGMRQMKNKL